MCNSPAMPLASSHALLQRVTCETTVKLTEATDPAGLRYEKPASYSGVHAHYEPISALNSMAAQRAEIDSADIAALPLN